MQKLGYFLLLIGLLLTACASATTPTEVRVGVQDPTLPAPTLDPVQALVQVEATPASAPTTELQTAAPTAEAQPTALVIQDTRRLVDVFKVSDPAQVNLAAGQPQLVEFFAFW